MKLLSVVRKHYLICIPFSIFNSMCRTKQLLLTILVCFNLIKASAQQVILFGSGTVSTCDAFILDADSMRGNYPVGTFIQTVNAANGTRLGLNFEEFAMRSYDTMWVYDGPTTNSPLIYYRPAPLYITFPSIQTSGSVITLRFKASSPGGNPAPGKFKLRVRCINDPQQVANFIPVARPLWGGNIQLADYDKDGDRDMLVGGEIYRNDAFLDSFYVFDRKLDVLGKWTSTKMLAQDFDNDGDKDIFIMGTSNIPGPFAAYCCLYRNNGNGSFTRVTTQSFTGAYDGACALVDFDRDGKKDICYTGRTNLSGTPVTVFKLYINHGALSFSDSTISGVPGLTKASISWADSDADGDDDLLVSGIFNGGNITRFFTVSGPTFTVRNIGMTDISNGQTLWVDINNDGKPDIVNAGIGTPGNINAINPQIFINNGSNNFTSLNNNLPAWYGLNQDWTDYDLDGDKDVVFSGYTSSNPITYGTNVFKNNGNGNFSVIAVDNVLGTATVKWVFLNADNRPDLFIAGRQGRFSFFLKNMGGDQFKVSSLPMSSFNVSGQALVEDFTGDGKIDMLICDVMDGVDCSGDFGSILTTAIDWRYTAIPKFTMVGDLNGSLPVPPQLFDNPYWKWGHYDSDGQLDILYINANVTTGYPYIAAFRNTGNNNFSLALNGLAVNLPGTDRNMREAALVDLDNDGVSELFITPNTVLKRSGNNWVVYYEGGGCNDIQDCYEYYAEFADFSGDGFKDAAISVGASLGTMGHVSIYKNDGTGKLVLYTTTTFSRDGRQVKWHDFDKDGDLDLVSGFVTLENRNGNFLGVNGGGRHYIHVGIGDFNKDGWDDLVVNTNNFVNAFYPGSILYNLQGTFFYKEVITGKLFQCDPSGWEDAIEAYDVDNDGDIDIPHTAGGGNCGSGLLLNLYNLQNRSISLWNPNGGEILPIGTAFAVRWIGNQLGANVRLELSRDNGANWQTVIASTVSGPTGGTYSWNVTGPVSANCLMRVTDNINGNTVDLSNQAFQITLATGIGSNPANDSVNVFPNPSSDELFITLPQNSGRNILVTIYNASGMLVQQNQVNYYPSQPLSLDISGLGKGFYILKIEDRQKKYSAKFIRQ